MTDQKIEYEIQGDSSDATRAVAGLSREITALLTQIGHAENRLGQLFSKKLPDQLKSLERFVQGVNAANSAEFAQSAAASRRFARTASAGGPAAQIDNALFSGVLSNLRTDKALQALRYEKEVNKVLEARRMIYEKIRQDGLSEADQATAYRTALKELGYDVPNSGTTARRRFNESTLKEVRQFEDGIQARQLRDRIDRDYLEALAENRQRQQRFDDDYTAAMRENRERQKRADDQFSIEYEQAMAENRRRTKAQQDAYRASPEGRQERARAGVGAVQDRFELDGGAAMFGVQARVMANYATMEAVLGTLFYAGASGIEFEAGLKKLQAISKATDIDLNKLKMTIFEVGRTTNFSVQQISEAATVMAQAGYSAQQIDQAIKPISQLASGAGASLEDATNIVTSILDIYNLSIERTGVVSNTLTAALNESKLSLEQLTLGVQYAGNISASAGVSFEELTSALGAMANAGIKSGSTLGTGFRSLLQELQSPSEKFQAKLKELGLTLADVDIKSVGLYGALQNLKNAGFGSAEALSSFELRAAAAFTALSGNLDVFGEMQSSIVGTNAAVQASNTQMESFAAQWQTLLNAVVQFTIVAGAPLLTLLTGIVSVLASVVGALSTMGPVLQIVGTGLAAWGLAKVIVHLAGLVVGLTGVTGASLRLNLAAMAAAIQIGGIRSAAISATASLRTLTLAMAANPVGLLTIAITGLVTAFGMADMAAARAAAKLQEFDSAVSKAEAEVGKYKDRVSEIDGYIDQLSNRHASLASNTTLAGQAATIAVGKFGAWGDQLKGNLSDVNNLIDALRQLRKEQLDNALLQAQTAEAQSNQGLEEARRAFNGWMTGPKANLRAEARHLIGGPNSAIAKSSGLTAGELGGLLDGSLSITDASRIREKLTGKAGFKDLLPKLNDYILSLGEVMQRRQGSEQATRTRQELETLRGGAFQGANTAAENLILGQRDRDAATLRITDPKARLDAQLAERNRRIDDAKTFAGDLAGYIKQALADPEQGAAIRDYARRQGIKDLAKAGELYFVERSPEIAKVLRQGSPVDASSDPEVQEAEAKTQKALADRLRAQGRLQEAEEANTRYIELRISALRAKGVAKGDDPVVIDAEAEQLRQELTERGTTAGINAGNRAESAAQKAARGQARHYASEVRTLKAQIENLSAGGQGSSLDAVFEALIQQESGGRPGILGPMTRWGRAQGLTQMLPGTAKQMAEKLGIAWRPELMTGKTPEAAAYQRQLGRAYFDEGMAKYGNVQDALKYYHGGPDQSLWGPKTRRYAEEVMARVGPDRTLDQLLEEWKAAREKEITLNAKANGLSDEQLGEELENFRTVEAPAFIAEMTGGAIEAAREVLVGQAKRNEEQVKRRVQNQLANGASLEDGIENLQAAIDSTLLAELDQIDAQFAKDKLTGSQKHLEARADKLEETAQRTADTIIDAINTAVEAAAERAALEVERKQLEIDAERSNIAKQDNPYNRDRLSDVRRRQNQRALEGLDRDERQLDLTTAQTDYNLAVQKRDKYAGLAAQDPERYSEEHRKAARAAEEAAIALERAQLAMEELTGEAPTFSSWSEAITASWDDFVQRMQESKPILEQLADGMAGVFDEVKGGLGQMIRDVVTGTKTMGDAFKDFTLRVLESVLDMISEMMAKQMVMWFIEMIGSMRGGGAGGSGGGMPKINLNGKYQGGLIRYAHGGPAPFRDSVPALLQPGEFVMSKSATDFIGVDTLSTMNAMANRRIAQVPQIEKPKEREPDTVNVWLVPQGTKPTPGKKDFVMAIVEDMTTGGQTKQLIKAISMGNM